MLEPLHKPQVTVEYCPKCKWLLRAAWMAQELLSTFEVELGGVLLQPSTISGAYNISLDGETIWSRAQEQGFPDLKELKTRVRDKVAPEKSLGHLEK